MELKISLNTNLELLSKSFFLLYCVYKNVLSLAGFYVSSLSIFMLFGALAFCLICRSCIMKVEKSFLIYLIFVIYVLASGYIVAVNKGTLIDATKTIAEFLVVFYLIIDYSKHDGNVNFSMITFIIQAIVACVLVLKNGTIVEGRATFAENVNVNTIGMMATFSIGYVLFIFIKKKKQIITDIFVVGVIFLFAIVILQTVSKKSIISSFALIVFWFVLCFRTAFMRINIFLRIGIFVALCFVTTYVYQWYISNYGENFNFLMYRMSLISDGNSANERKNLIFEGIRVFKEKPLFGVGLNNFRFFNSVRETYSHCFYTEILACTGIIGACIFITPIVTAVKTIKTSIVFFKNDRESKVELLYMLGLVIVFGFVCSTQIIFYEFNLMYYMAVLIAYAICIRQKTSNIVI